MVLMAKGTKTGGRVAGVPNKATAQAREAIAAFVEGNTHRLQEWLDSIASENPEKAFNMFQSVIEYHVPKLSRSELTGKDGGAIVTETNMSETDKQILADYQNQIKTKGK